MRYSLYINQVKMLEWGLNLSQAVVFNALTEATSWANSAVFEGEVYYWFAKEKLMKELPVITDKPDTIKRHLSALDKAGLIRRKVVVEGNNTYHYIAITAKGKEWNTAQLPAESEDGKNIPTPETSQETKEKNLPEAGNISQNAGKNIPEPREKNPPNYITNNPNTNDPKDLMSDSAESNATAPVVHVEKFDAKAKRELLTQSFEHVWAGYGRRGSKKPAKEKFLKLKLADDYNEALAYLQNIITKAEQWGALYAQNPNEAQWQPHCVRWINEEKWNDEHLPTLKTNQAQPHHGGHHHATRKLSAAERAIEQARQLAERQRAAQSDEHGGGYLVGE